ncbi:MAG: indole-3-glycerol phosphate synthase TrpC [Actinomycetota bacterium]|nr:indole-3-glycerol phosphate synthase TrpC [Actinomycetota bacterium]
MSVLEEILDGVRTDLAERQRRVEERELRRVVDAATPTADPMPALRRPGLSVIAEVKRRSPSKGQLAKIADPAALAREYAAGGAEVISVLTEGRRFGGSLADLRAVRASLPTPLLRKDFIVSEYQLLESRAAGADLVLLVVAALDEVTLPKLFAAARALGLIPLVEVHDRGELDRAVDVGAELVGINARDLATLQVDPDTFGRLVGSVPEGVVTVAESGITGVADAERYAREGADALLVGETLVRDGDPAASVAAMRAVRVPS